jgi:hypothetical protein
MMSARLAGLSCAAILAIPLAAQKAASLADPVQLTANGKVIDTNAEIGHAGPLLFARAGEDKPDLLVSSFAGLIRRFVNTGTRAAPQWREKDPLQAGGEPIRIHNW